MTEEEITKALEGYRHEIASLKHRMNDMERIVDAVHGLALEMARQTEEIKHMNESIKQLNEDVAALKAKPVKRWDTLINTLIGAIVGAAMALFAK